jgi:transposase-like protein
MPEPLMLLGGFLLLGIVAYFMLRSIRIKPKCPQCESMNCDIYDSRVIQAYLDCQCHDCGYKWREE